MEIEIGSRLLVAVLTFAIVAMVERWWHYASRRRP
jgi:hypothetical protein